MLICLDDLVNKTCKYHKLVFATQLKKKKKEKKSCRLFVEGTRAMLTLGCVISASLNFRLK